LENFERGEIVSPEDALPARDRVPNLATPDARHRRPLKFLFTLYYQSVKATLVPKGEESFKQMV
jgi:hypothetical protein